MLVSHRHKFIYCKTLKTAGTSVEAYFERFCVDDGGTPKEYRTESVSEVGIVGNRSARANSGEWWNHMPAKQIRDKIGVEIWNSYLKFCCIRNPFDKVLSAFAWFEATGQIKQASGLDERQRFERWLTEVGPQKDRHIYTIQGNYCMDAVIRYESLHADVAKLCDRLGVPWEPERLPAFKTGIRADNMSVERMYSPQARKVVEEVYAFELKFFGYDFPAEQAAAG